MEDFKASWRVGPAKVIICTMMRLLCYAAAAVLRV